MPLSGASQQSTLNCCKTALLKMHRIQYIKQEHLFLSLCQHNCQETLMMTIWHNCDDANLDKSTNSMKKSEGRKK